MPLNPILAQQIDSLMSVLGLDDKDRSVTIKENLAAAIIDVANASEVKDDSRYLRIEAHFKILLDKLLKAVNDLSSEQQETQDFEKRLQMLRKQLNEFKKILLQTDAPPMTLDALQDEYNRMQGILNARTLRLSAQIRSILTRATHQSQETKDALAKDAEEITRKLYPALLDRFAEYSKILEAPIAEEYFKDLSFYVADQDGIEVMRNWLIISGASEVNAIDENMLKVIAGAHLSENIRGKLNAYAGIESMLAAILLTAAKEQLLERDETSGKFPIKIAILEELFAAYPNISWFEDKMQKIVTAQQQLFLQACQWRTFVSEEQFTNTTHQLLSESYLSTEAKSNIEKLIQRDADLHSTDAEIVNNAKKFFHEEEKKQTKPYAWFKSLYQNDKRLSKAAEKSPTQEKQDEANKAKERTPHETSLSFVKSTLRPKQ